MGETDEKDIVPAETPINDHEEPKETEKLLNSKKGEIEHQNGVKSDDEEKAVEEEKKTNGEEIIDIPENPPKEDGREVKPRKIPIGGIKMPGFFRKSKPPSDGAEGELLENADEPKAEEEKSKEAETTSSKPKFLSNIKFTNPFAKKASVDQPEETVENKDGGKARGRTYC